MSQMTRRDCLLSAAGLVGSAGLLANPLLAAKTKSDRTSFKGRAGIKLALFGSLGPFTTLGLQMGVRHAIIGAGLGAVPRDRYLDTLKKIRSDYEAAGVTIAGVESHPVPAEKIKLGLPGRDEEIENYIAAINALSQVGIRMICYNFMAGLGWFRTRTDIRERGGALTSEFDSRDAEAMGPTEWGEVSEQKIWDNITYFQKAVIPAAEKAGVKMALHPDDPVVSPLRGIGRILTSARNFLLLFVFVD